MAQLQPSRRGWSLLLLALALSFSGSGEASAQSVSDYQVKAAYVYSFAKFVEWPQSSFPSPTAPIRFCILNDSSFEAELNRIVKGRSIAGRPLEVVPVRAGEQSRGCHFLFISSASERQIRHIAEVLRGASVVTIGEADDFLKEGGTINFVLEDDRVQFQINHKAAKAMGVYISAQLLHVARLVVE